MNDYSRQKSGIIDTYQPVSTMYDSCKQKELKQTTRQQINSV